MQSSTPIPKFLLDENVRIELFKFLKKSNVDAKLAPKSASDRKLASISSSENRILITNDEDFTQYSKEEIYSAIWLRIPQKDSKKLLTVFSKLIKTFRNFEGKLIMLGPAGWEEIPLLRDIK